MYYYGVKSASHAKDLAREVNRTLGGGYPAYCILLETAATETLLGTYADSSPESHGVGLCQCDQIGLDDIKQEGEQRHFDLIKDKFGYDIPSVELADLADDPLLALIICRLRYKRVPAPIPQDVEGRAHYWKAHYNSFHPNAKGTPEKYLKRVNDCLGEL